MNKARTPPTITRARVKGLWSFMIQFGQETCNNPDLDDAAAKSARVYVEQLRDWWEAKYGEDVFEDERRRERSLAGRIRESGAAASG